MLLNRGRFAVRLRTLGSLVDLTASSRALVVQTRLDAPFNEQTERTCSGLFQDSFMH